MPFHRVHTSVASFDQQVEGSVVAAIRPSTNSALFITLQCLCHRLVQSWLLGWWGATVFLSIDQVKLQGIVVAWVVCFASGCRVNGLTNQFAVGLTLQIAHVVAWNGYTCLCRHALILILFFICAIKWSWSLVCRAFWSNRLAFFLQCIVNVIVHRH